MYELIAAAVIAISTAIAKGVKRLKTLRLEEGLTSEAYKKEGDAIANAGWNTISKGFAAGNNLIEAGVAGYIQQRNEQIRIAQEEERFKKMLLWISIAAAALVIIILILKHKK